MSRFAHHLLAKIVEMPQRVVRGHFGRRKAYSEYKLIRAAQCIQKLYRNHNFFVTYLKRMRSYSRYATMIQVYHHSVAFDHRDEKNDRYIDGVHYHVS